MSKFIKLSFFLLSSILMTEVAAQQTLSVELEDQVMLTADAYRGTIQWESSTDQTDWQDVTGGDVNDFTVIVSQELTYFRARIEEEGCDTPHYSEIVTVQTTSSTSLWSDEATWGADGKPQEGDEVTIPEGQYIVLDENPPALGGLLIEGTLVFDRQDLALTSEWIVVNGTLRIGTEENPFEQKAIITLTDTDTEAEVMNMGTRGIMVMTGNLELHGAVPEVTWTKINEHGEAGATSISLVEDVDWKVDDEIVIAPTDYYEAGNGGVSITQKVAISEVEGSSLTLSEGLNAHRWGLLQYPTSEGMSLSQDNVVSPPTEDTDERYTPLVLDERAEVGNLTRNIVIQAPDDALWQDGFGAHTMIMPAATAHVEGVEFRRVGQAGRLRRYAFHWHMLSYEGTETLEDATGQYFRSNTINSSANRGVVIHGTNGVLVQNNIIYDVRGHGVFTEDAVERRNIIDGNLVLHVRNPTSGNALMLHERSGGGRGSSGFWIANPDNVVTNNIAADCQRFGFWLAFPERPWGLSSEVQGQNGRMVPNRIEFGVFDNNTAHSNRSDGIHLDNPQVNEAGGVFSKTYLSTTDEQNSFDNAIRFALSNITTWKNMDNGSWDRGVWSDLYGFVSADNCGRFFAGSGSEGIIERSLVVGTSLNFLMNGTGRPAEADFQFYRSAAPTAFASYHSAFSMRHNIVVNFQVTEYDRAGVFATDDYYFRPVDRGLVRNFENLIIDSDPGVKLKPRDDYFSFASALWDPYGFWGPEENYLVYDEPFFTFGKEVFEPELGVDIVGGVSVEGPFYGFLNFELHDDDPLDTMAIQVDRLNPSDLETVVGTWHIPAARRDVPFQHMRDFATAGGGIYILSFPESPRHPTNFHMEVENMKENNDTQLIGIQYDGSINPEVFIHHVPDHQDSYGYQELNSLHDVITSDGEAWWQDKENNLVWVNIRGGRWQANPEQVGVFEEETNETMNLRIRPQQ